MERILVTGANGFVGRRLLSRLLADGRTVTATSRASPPGAGTVGNVRWSPISDIGPSTDWQAALADCTCVVHLAAQVPGRDVEIQAFDVVNNQGTARLVEQAAEAGVTSFIMLSSIFALVDNASSQPLDDLSVSRASLPYGLSKLAAERHVAAFAQNGGAGVALRPPLVYGSDAKGNWRLLQRLAASPLPLPFGSIRNRRSLVAVENLVDAILSVVSAGDTAVSGAFALMEDAPVSLEQILSFLRDGMERPRRLLPIPPQALEFCLRMIGRSQMASSLLGDLEVDLRRFADVYRWSPKFGTGEGVKRSGSQFVGGSPPPSRQ